MTPKWLREVAVNREMGLEMHQKWKTIESTSTVLCWLAQFDVSYAYSKRTLTMRRIIVLPQKGGMHVVTSVTLKTRQQL